MGGKLHEETGVCLCSPTSCVASLPGPRQFLISCSTGNWQKASEGSFGDKASACVYATVGAHLGIRLVPVCMQLCISRHCYLLCVHSLL